MQNNYEKIFKATVKIEANDSNGTGFHFIDNKTIITNAHVIESAIKSGCKIHAKIGNNRFELNPISIINDDVNDFAILRSTINFPDDRELLQVAEDDDYRIGTEVVFSGFPHGFDDLILQRAIIAGHYNDNHNNFYLDGSVNGGNSGGPIIRLSDNSIIGIVSARRFIKGDLDKLISSVNEFKGLAIQQSKTMSISFGGINYNVEMAKSLANIANVFNSVVLRNANAGLGIGQKIRNVINKYKESIDT